MNYSISDLEQLSGVSAHKIRIWERRYHALQPDRSPGNTRSYSEEQLRRLLNIVSLNHAGLKISTACNLNEQDINVLLRKEMDGTIADEEQFEFYISQIISNGLAYREASVNHLISQCLLGHGMLTTYREVIYPVLVRLGLMWQSDSACPSQEHFLSSLFRQKIFSAIDGLQMGRETASSWVLFLPEDEDHDIGLLLANYLLRISGHRVIYLGARVPLYALKLTVNDCKPDHLLFFMTRIRPAKDAQSYIDEVGSLFRDMQLYVSGNSRLEENLSLNGNVSWLKDIRDFEYVLKSSNDAL